MESRQEIRRQWLERFNELGHKFREKQVDFFNTPSWDKKALLNECKVLERSFDKELAKFHTIRAGIDEQINEASAAIEMVIWAMEYVRSTCESLENSVTIRETIAKCEEYKKKWQKDQ